MGHYILKFYRLKVIFFSFICLVIVGVQTIGKESLNVLVIKLWLLWAWSCSAVISLVTLTTAGWMSATEKVQALSWGWWGSGTDCREDLWMLHPWMCSWPGGMRLWVTWSSERGLWPRQKVWNIMIFKCHSNPTNSTFLIFHYINK